MQKERGQTRHWSPLTVARRHYEKALAGLLLDSPHFLWITRGAAVWGHDQAMKRFAGLFQATWKLAPALLARADEVIE
jgi:hypothetical protein